MHINEWSLRSSILASALVFAGGFMSAAVAEEEGGAGFEEWAAVVGDPVEDCGEACMFTTEVVEGEVLPGDEVVEDPIVLEDGVPVVDPLPEDCGEACMSTGEEVVEEIPVDDCGDCIFYTMDDEATAVDDGGVVVVDPLPDGTEGCGDCVLYTMGAPGDDDKMVEDGINNIRTLEGADNDLEMIPQMSATGAESNALESAIDISGAAGIADYLEATALEGTVETSSVDTAEIAISDGQPAVDVAQMEGGDTISIRGGHLK